MEPVAAAMAFLASKPIGYSLFFALVLLTGVAMVGVAAYAFKRRARWVQSQEPLLEALAARYRGALVQPEERHLRYFLWLPEQAYASFEWEGIPLEIYATADGGEKSIYILYQGGIPRDKERRQELEPVLHFGPRSWARVLDKERELATDDPAFREQYVVSFEASAAALAQELFSPQVQASLLAIEEGYPEGEFVSQPGREDEVGFLCRLKLNALPSQVEEYEAILAQFSVLLRQLPR